MTFARRLVVISHLRQLPASMAAKGLVIDDGGVDVIEAAHWVLHGSAWRFKSNAHRYVSADHAAVNPMCSSVSPRNMYVGS